MKLEIRRGQKLALVVPSTVGENAEPAYSVRADPPGTGSASAVFLCLGRVCVDVRSTFAIVR